MEGVKRARSDYVGCKEDEDEDEGVDPCVFERDVFPAAEEGFGFSSFVTFLAAARWGLLGCIGSVALRCILVLFALEHQGRAAVRSRARLLFHSFDL